ncbi:MAG: phosphatase PAP2 family protein [Gaiellaceae bacterium]
MRGRTSLLSCFAAATVALLWAAVYVDSALVGLDRAAVGLLHRVATDDVVALAAGVSALAGTTAVLLVAAVAAGSLLLRGQRHGAVSLALAVAGTQAVVLGIKELVARARPPASSSFVDAAGHAFPSAHAASSVALYGLLAYLLLRRIDGPARTVTAVLTLAGVGVIGLTRVYLGAHYPSDVVAGWLVGALVAAAAWRLSRSLRPRVAF